MKSSGGKPRPRLPALSLAFALLALAWGLLARARSETWWWVAALDVVPPQVLLPLPLGLAWVALRRRSWNWAALDFAVLLACTTFQVCFEGAQIRSGTEANGLPLLVLSAHRVLLVRLRVLSP